jgi:hypothetical protein
MSTEVVGKVRLSIFKQMKINNLEKVYSEYRRALAQVRDFVDVRAKALEIGMRYLAYNADQPSPMKQHGSCVRLKYDTH